MNNLFRECKHSWTEAEVALEAGLCPHCLAQEKSELKDTLVAVNTLLSMYARDRATLKKTVADQGAEISEHVQRIRQLENQLALASGIADHHAERLKDLRDKASALVTKLDAVEEPVFNIMKIAGVHGYHYNGPTYDQELKQVRECL